MPEISPSRYMVNAGFDDVPHLDEKTKREIIDSTMPHLQDARSKGTPSLGAGAVWPIPLSEILVDPFEIPPYWARSYGLDVGWNKTAVVWGAIDRSVDVAYLYTEHYRGKAEPSIHASAIKARGEWIPGVIDPAARSRGQRDGLQLMTDYLELGLDLIPAKNPREAGLYTVWERLSTGRLKVFSTLMNWQAEYRLYRRDDDGNIVKEYDHCLHPDTLVCTDRGKLRIADLVGTEGRVRTVGGGWARYLDCRMTATDQPVVRVAFEDGNAVICTPDHRFLTDAGWVKAQDMSGVFCYDAVSQSIKLEPSCRSRSSRRQFRSIGGFATTCAENIFNAMACAYIGWFGKTSMAGLCLLDTPFITRMRTDPTTSRPTSNSLLVAVIHRFTKRGTNEDLQMPRGKPQGTGMEVQRAASGIDSTTPTPKMRCIVTRNISVRIAASGMRPKSPAKIGFVQTAAKAKQGGFQAWTTLTGLVSSAARFFASTVTTRKRPAASHALVRCRSVTDAGRSDVYCLRVPSTEAFAVEGGAVVHNCMDAMRYWCVSGIAIAKVQPAPKVGLVPAIADRAVGY